MSGEEQVGPELSEDDVLMFGRFLPHEADILGITSEKNVVLKSGQVSSKYGWTKSDGGKMMLWVKAIQVVDVDPITNQLSYRITGINTLAQNWEPGGFHLAPESLDDIAL